MNLCPYPNCGNVTSKLCSGQLRTLYGTTVHECSGTNTCPYENVCRDHINYTIQICNTREYDYRSTNKTFMNPNNKIFMSNIVNVGFTKCTYHGVTFWIDRNTAIIVMFGLCFIYIRRIRGHLFYKEILSSIIPFTYGTLLKNKHLYFSALPQDINNIILLYM